jgi:hypothetical protein
MNRPYTAHSPYSLSPTERIPSHGDDGGVTVDLDRERHDEHQGLEDYENYDDDYDDYEPIDRRWMWIAGVAGAILLVAVICTVVILGGGDSGSVSTTIAPPTPTTTRPAATTSAPPAATTPSATTPPAAPLPPETMTTVTPTASAPPSDTPTEAAPSPRTITYRVTGNRQLLDLVTVIYTDAQGALQTDVNVALPWSKTVVLDPGVELSSVTATSVMGQLNCSVTDASGTAIAVQNNNTMIANCTK